LRLCITLLHMTSKQVFVRLRRRRVASRYPQRDLISSRKSDGIHFM